MTTSTLDKKQLLALYRGMVLIRRSEEQLARSHQKGLIHGACHTYVGQEAIAVGVCAHLRREDVVFSTHRGHGHALAKGVAPRQLFAELLGRERGLFAGQGGLDAPVRPRGRADGNKRHRGALHPSSGRGRRIASSS